MELGAIVDARTHARLESAVAHARELAREVRGLADANLLGWVARYEYERGDYRSAASLRRRESAELTGLLGDEHPATLTSMGNLAATLWAQGELAGAPACRRVPRTPRRLLGDEHPDTLTSMNNLAETLGRRATWPGRAALQEPVLAARRRVLGEEHPDTLTA